MEESKILEEDKNEWFYQSLKRYSHLYMFELEFPVDAIQIINDTSICISGMQNFSKKCEILQLSIPPKLLPKDLEEGLCKDRDFKIISGGYSNNRIIQIKPLQTTTGDFVVTTQENTKGITIFQLGDDDNAVIKERRFLDLPIDSSFDHPVIDTFSEQIIAIAQNSLYKWTTQNDQSSKFDLNLTENESIDKVKFWDENSLVFSTSKGSISLFDLRSNSSVFSEPKENPNPGVLYTFDLVQSENLISLVDSNALYLTFDIRSKGKRNSVNLPGLDEMNAVIKQKFNMEFDPLANGEELKFVVTGLKQDCVNVYKDCKGEIQQVFIHDGHSRTVSHATWHHLTKNLLLSTSVDSVLHAWQFIQ